MSLYPLIDHLTSKSPEAGVWNEWQIQPIAGGANGLVYHVSSEAGDFAVKFTLRDQRQRAKREYLALLALQQAEADITPEPILIDQSLYAQDVVVQSWLEGEVMNAPPKTDSEWQQLIEHFVQIHSFTPATISQTLYPAVLNFASPEAGKATVEWQISHLPPEARPTELQSLWQRLQTRHFPDWGESPVRLVRADPNTLNIIRRDNQWASVDWENSGWGDPAFEIADMMIHPAYITVPQNRWNWVVNSYIRLVDDPAAEARIRTYYCILSVWWVARLARFLYEIPRGLDQRLIERPSEWQPQTQQKYEHYLNLVQNLMGR